MGIALRIICRFVAFCALLGILACVLGIVADLMHAGGTSLPTHFGSMTLRFQSDLPETPGVPFVWQAAAALLNDIPNLLNAAALFFLIHLMLLYAQDEVFSALALRHFNAIAVCFLAGVLAGFAVGPLATLVQSWPLGAGHRFISVSFGTKDLTALFQAAIIFVIARVMNRAQSLAEENARFV
jgi:hypothetical protein